VLFTVAATPIYVAATPNCVAATPFPANEFYVLCVKNRVQKQSNFCLSVIEFFNRFFQHGIGASLGTQ